MEGEQALQLSVGDTAVGGQWVWNVLPERLGGVREGVKVMYRALPTLANSDSSPGGGSHGEFEQGEFERSAFRFNRTTLAGAQNTDGGQGDGLGGSCRDQGELR